MNASGELKENGNLFRKVFGDYSVPGYAERTSAPHPIVGSLKSCSGRNTKEALQTGIVLELEGAYGFHHTFIGQLQHGTQFKGANYYLQGHWETTKGEEKSQREEHITGQVKLDWDLSTQSKFSCNSSYFQSSVAVPQAQNTDARHKKSAIQLIAGLQWNLETDTNLLLSGRKGELANFDDQEKSRFEMN